MSRRFITVIILALFDFTMLLLFLFYICIIECHGLHECINVVTGHLSCMFVIATDAVEGFLIKFKIHAESIQGVTKLSRH